MKKRAKKAKFHWKKFPKVGCRCVRSTDKIVKSTNCKRKKSPCAKRRRKTFAPMLPMDFAPNTPLVPPEMIETYRAPASLTGLRRNLRRHLRRLRRRVW